MGFTRYLVNKAKQPTGKSHGNGTNEFKKEPLVGDSFPRTQNNPEKDYRPEWKISDTSTSEITVFFN
jgi:hypothetical protein